MRSKNSSTTKNGTSPSNFSFDANLEMFQSIKDRLEEEIPTGPFVSEDAVCELLQVEKKTLQNDRCAVDRRYPPFVRYAGSRYVQYPRADLIEWMSRQEVLSRTRRIYRCL